MAERIRLHDWADTPLGPIASWPPRLKHAVETMLELPMPAWICWGPDLIQIYNDRHIALLGDRHPGALGRPALETWGEIATLLRKAADDLFQGGPLLSYVDQEFAIARDGGALEPVWLTGGWSPLRDDHGGIKGCLGVAIDTTERVLALRSVRLSEEHQSYLLELSDALRGESDPVEIQAKALNVLGRRLGATRVMYGEVTADGEHIDFARCFVAEGASLVLGRFRMADYGPTLVQELSQGRAIVVPEIASSPMLTPGEQAAYEALGIRAILGVPLVKAGRLAANISVHQSEVRQWRPFDVQLVEQTAERTWAAVQQARAEAGMREAQARLESALEAARMVSWRWDPETDLVEPSRTADQLFGLPPGHDWHTSRQGFALVHPEDRDRHFDLASEGVRTGKGWRSEFRIIRPVDGQILWLEEHTHPVLDPATGRTFFMGLVADISERKAAEAALRDSEERFRQFGDASSDVLWIRRVDDLQWEYLTPAFEQIYGLPREEALRGTGLTTWMELILPEDRDRAAAGIARVAAGERSVLEYRIRRPDGQVRWIRNTDFPLRDDSGRVRRIGGIGHDVTQEKRTAERLGIMVRELQHRTRNLIAVVASMAKQTGAAATSLPAFIDEFSRRLESLSRVQGLLSREDRDEVELSEIVNSELDALGAARLGKRLSVSGPPVRLPSKIVQMLALALHELATNARKHGALSTASGRLSVAWQVSGETGAGSRVVIDWREDGTPPPTEGGVLRRGYGRELIEEALPYTLDARTIFELEGRTLHCRIDLPADPD
jgi:PAS domain S-box-containing protein